MAFNGKRELTKSITMTITEIRNVMRNATNVKEWNELRALCMNECDNMAAFSYHIDQSGLIVEVLGRDRKKKKRNRKAA